MNRETAVTVRDAFIDRMPKAEIHIHLEGAVRPRTVLELAAKYDLPLATKSEAELAEFFTFVDFPHFIRCYQEVCQSLRAPEDFQRIAAELGEDAAEQNIRYLEIHFNPEPHVRKRGLDFHDMLAGMNAGRAWAREQFGVEMRWIADGVRDADTSPASVTRTADWIVALDASDGVIGLGLGGNEVGFPPAPFAADFARVRAAGLHTVAHAGETTGPGTIRDSLSLLGAERIGHGISAIEDAALIAELAERQIPLELCPTSNVRTALTPLIVDHPFPLFDQAGVLVTVNSDDPPLFNTTLTNEFRVLADHWNYSLDDLERVAANAIRASFLDDAAKTRLLAEFAAENAALRAELGLPPNLAAS